VLDSGYLSYYVERLPTPPYGKNMKGRLCMADYTPAVEGNRIRLGNARAVADADGADDGEFKELIIEVPQGEVEAWTKALMSHRYCYTAILLYCYTAMLLYCYSALVL
jgi:hypothetical protein